MQWKLSKVDCDAFRSETLDKKTLKVNCIKKQRSNLTYKECLLLFTIRSYDSLQEPLFSADNDMSDKIIKV